MQKAVKRELLAISVLLSALIILTGIFAGRLFFFDPMDYSATTAASLNIKEEAASNYPFPPVKASIFSSLIAVKQEEPKPVIKKVELPPVDPYEAVTRDLRMFSFFGKSGESVFLAKGDNMYSVKIGDKLEDKYLIKEVKDNSVLIGLPGDDSFKFEITAK